MQFKLFYICLYMHNIYFNTDNIVVSIINNRNFYL